MRKSNETKIRQIFREELDRFLNGFFRQMLYGINELTKEKEKKEAKD